MTTSTTLELTENFQIALSMLDDTDIKLELAEMEGICDEAQMNLAVDQDPEILKVLAQNPTVSEDALSILAESLNLDEETMLILAESEYEMVRYELASNPKICQEAQAILINDDDDEVVEALIENNNFDKSVFLMRNR